MTEENEEMNEELRRWLEEHGDEVHDEEEAEERFAADVSGRCIICKARQAKYRCVRCGKAVCPSCFLVLYGLCRNCASPDTARRLKNGEKDYGVDIIK
ncbi:MAG: hypothetical protein ACP5FL_08570 [Thermoplasmatota archaeon]